MATEAGVCAILNTFFPSLPPAIIGKDAKMKSHPRSLRGAYGGAGVRDCGVHDFLVEGGTPHERWIVFKTKESGPAESEALVTLSVCPASQKSLAPLLSR